MGARHKGIRVSGEKGEEAVRRGEYMAPAAWGDRQLTAGTEVGGRAGYVGGKCKSERWRREKIAISGREGVVQR